MTDLLTAFLLERLEEDEKVAREANGRVAWLTLRYPDGSMRYTTVGHQMHDDVPFWLADGHGIDAQDVFVFYDSARVLAECAAKRRIVTECGWVTVMRLLAQPYADHKDFREDWRL